MSDDLAAQIEKKLSDLVKGWIEQLEGLRFSLGGAELKDLQTIYPRIVALEAHLDRDRKMKAELANSLKGLAVDIGSVRLELTSTKALDSPRLDFVQSELLKEAAKLEAADSKTEASEK